MKRAKVFVTLLMSLIFVFSSILPAFAVSQPSVDVFELVEDDESQYGYANTAWVNSSGEEVDIGSRVSVSVSEDHIVGAASLPSKYDARTYGIITPPKNQGTTGGCWSFGSMSACETNAIKKGLISASEADFAEAHLAWFTYTMPADKSDPLYGEGYENSSPCSYGGNWQRACSTLSEWSGIQSEKDFRFYYVLTNNPYACDENDVLYRINDVTIGNFPESARYTNNGLLLKNAKKFTTGNDVKQWIVDNGSCTALINYQDKYYTSAYNSFYCYDSETGTNHMITIIGWDDTFSKDKFLTSSKPQQNGAWLIKNSWGTNWGDSGYFWVSYEDKSMTDFVGFEVQKNEYKNVYTYSGIYPNTVMQVSGAKGCRFGNVYTAKGKEMIKAVSLYTFVDNCNYTVKIYKLKSATALPESGTLLTSFTTNVLHQGYNQIELPAATAINAGDVFSVCFINNNDMLYVPIEHKTGVTSGVGVTYNTGKCYIGLKNSSTSWTATTSYKYGDTTDTYGDIAINVLTVCNHEYNYSITKPATCTEVGTKTGSCLYCDSTVTETIPVLNHSMGYIEAVEPDCTHFGNKAYYYCKTCGDLFLDAAGKNKTDVNAISLVPNGHQLTKHSAVSSDCKQQGNVEYYTCSVCKKYFSDSNGKSEISASSIYLPLGAHITGPEVIENYVAESCTSKGSYDKVHYCTVCQKELIREHETIECSKHNLTYVKPVAATCEANGSIGYYKCGDCKKLFADSNAKTEIVLTDTVVKAKGHTGAASVKENEVASTCGSEGYYDSVVYCETCGKELSRTQVHTGYASHSLKYVEGVPAACNKTGLAAHYECTECHFLFSDAEGKNAVNANDLIVAKTAHKSNGVAVKENEIASTCGSEGYYDSVVYCETCGKELSRTQVHTGYASHTLKYVEAVPAACNKTGLAAHYECTKCHFLFSDVEGKNAVSANDLIIAETSHKSNGIAVMENETESSCSVKGSYDEVYYCKDCGKEMSRTVKYKELKPHTPVHINEVSSTCREHGCAEHYKCEKCGVMFADEACTKVVSDNDLQLPFAEHKAGSAVKENATQSTCTVQGGYDNVTYCVYCNKVISSIHISTGYKQHSLTEHKVVANSCSRTGNKAYYECTVCKKLFGDSNAENEILFADTIIPAKQHEGASPVTENEVSSTCCKHGHYESVTYCVHCGCEMSRIEKELPFVQHTLVYNKGANATCQNAGLKPHYQCTVCLGLFGDKDGTTAVTTKDLYISPKDHVAGPEVETGRVDATCCKSGVRHTETYCSECHALLSEHTYTIEPTGRHSLVCHEAKAATCAEEGNTEYYTCEVCGMYFDAQSKKIDEKSIVIPKTDDHKWQLTDQKEEKNKTINTYTCEICKEKKVEEVEHKLTFIQKVINVFVSIFDLIASIFK